MRAPFVLAALLILAPTVQAATTIEGRVTASAIQTSAEFDSQGDGLFLGFFLDSGTLPGWQGNAARLQVDLTSYPYAAYTPVHQTEGEPVHHVVGYGASTITKAYTPAETQQSQKFWLLVMPAPEGGDGFTIAGSWPSTALQSKESVDFFAQRRFSGTPVVGDWRAGNINQPIYQAAQPALEWKPEGTAEQLVIRGDFVLAVFQADFEVTEGGGRTDRFSTGDEDPGLEGFDPAEPLYHYNQTRADITFTDGELTLLPNGWPIQLDLATSSATVNGAVDLEGAVGQLQDGGAAHAIAGRLRLDADALEMTLRPHGTAFEAAFSGTVRSAFVDGRAVEFRPEATALAPADPPNLALGAAIAGTLLVLVGVAFAVRSRTATPLLMARAQAFFEVGSTRSALRTCRRVLRRQSGHADATALATMCLIRLGRAEAARPLIEQSKALGHEDDGLVAMAESLVLYHTGQPATALDRLEHAFIQHPALNDELAALDLRDQLRATMRPVGAVQ